MSRFAGLIVALSAAAGAGLPVTAAGRPPVAALEELRHGLTVGGKPIPPELFRDFGDGDLADSGGIWVSVDVLAAVGSNLYADPIKTNGAWVTRAKAGAAGGTEEESAYRFIGTTRGHLIVVVARYNGGGSGTFCTLHVLDAAKGRGFDLEGRLYDRLNLTAIRSMALGDRWDGAVTISGDRITVTTTRDGPADDSRSARTVTIRAARP